MAGPTAIGFDADDTLWQNEQFFKLTEARFAALLEPYAASGEVGSRLLATERRNLAAYGFGIKGFVLSMIETAIEVTEARVPASVIEQILAAGREMLAHPVETLPHAAATLRGLSGSYRLILITKGDLFDQERKLAASGLGELFDAVEVVSDKTPATYDRIFRRHADGAERAMMVGNSLRSDVIPAIEAGAWGVHVPHELMWEVERAEAPVEAARYRQLGHLGELAGLLEDLRMHDSLTQPLLTQQGMRMPKLGLGTWKLSGEEGRRAVAGAIELGYRHIDTARMYDNEDAVGDALASVSCLRRDIHVTSKVWHSELAPDALRRSLETSLRLLRLEYIDLYLIHWPARGMDLPAALGALMQARDEGLVRAIGVSNFSVALMRQAVEEVGAPIACNQVEYHVGLGQRAVLGYAREHGIAVAAYTPLGRGGLASDKRLAAIARKHGASAGQVALKWLLDQDGVAAIPKAARRENQRANLDALSLTLDDEDRAAIDALPKDGRLVDPGWAEWDSH